MHTTYIYANLLRKQSSCRTQLYLTSSSVVSLWIKHFSCTNERLLQIEHNFAVVWLSFHFVFSLCVLSQEDVEWMTSKSLNIVTADTVWGILVCLLLFWYRWTLPRASMAPDSISVSPRLLFPGTDILQGASGGVCRHCVDQVMSEPFHSSCDFIQWPFRDAEEWRH